MLLAFYERQASNIPIFCVNQSLDGLGWCRNMRVCLSVCLSLVELHGKDSLMYIYINTHNYIDTHTKFTF